MQDFFSAAFAWVVMGVATALIAAVHTVRNAGQKSDGEDTKAREKHMTDGMCIVHGRDAEQRRCCGHWARHVRGAVGRLNRGDVHQKQWRNGI